MFTLKFYDSDAFRTRIEAADSITILRGACGMEITLHRNSGNDIRIDLAERQMPVPNAPPAYHRVIIENGAGKTTEIIHAPPVTVEQPVERLAA